MVTTIAALAALWFTSQSLRATGDQYGLAKQTAITDRFNKAVEQLANKEALDVRLGGIYSLERLANDAPDTSPVVFEVLGAFVRTHSPKNSDCGKDEDFELAPDIQAVLTVIGRRDMTRKEPIDLSKSCMAAADLDGANLQGAKLNGANLQRAGLNNANLTGASASKVQLDYARFWGTNLTNTRFYSADLRWTVYVGTTLDGTVFSEADLRGANLQHAEMRRVDLSQADLRGTIFLSDGSYGGNSSTDVPGAQSSAPVSRTSDTASYEDNILYGAKFDEWTRWPAGFTP
ncbi:pentapeptide repeat-containing protein [Nocardia sp. NPDC055321]